jgi:hypothetical protein
VSKKASNVPENVLEECRALLNRLPGVFAAGIRTGSEGEINEIHVLASSSRNPKQMARDIQSALLAAFALDVDHRFISIANCPATRRTGRPFLPPEVFNARLRYKHVVLR